MGISATISSGPSPNAPADDAAHRHARPPAIRGRPPRISGERVINVPISVTAILAIEHLFQRSSQPAKTPLCRCARYHSIVCHNLLQTASATQNQIALSRGSCPDCGAVARSACSCPTSACPQTSSRRAHSRPHHHAAMGRMTNPSRRAVSRIQAGSFANCLHRAALVELNRSTHANRFRRMPDDILKQKPQLRAGILVDNLIANIANLFPHIKLRLDMAAFFGAIDSDQQTCYRLARTRPCQGGWSTCCVNTSAGRRAKPDRQERPSVPIRRRCAKRPALQRQLWPMRKGISATPPPPLRPTQSTQLHSQDIGVPVLSGAIAAPPAIQPNHSKADWPST